jgi:dTDP-4-dehydrorhamnose 3,5-epimerase
LKITELGFKGLLLIELAKHGDSRGHFIERWNKKRFADLDLPEFIQDNFSRSAAGVVRGLHYQHERPQGKLVTCLHGRILDVVVDLRKRSSTYGKHCAVELSSENATWVWIPPGFAHGFSVLSEDGADLWYKVDADYNAKGEGGIRWDDPALAIDWRVKAPVLSDRDRALATFEEYSRQPVF